MKFLGKDYIEVDKGYFGVRRCTICNDNIRDVNLVEVYTANYFCFFPIRKTLFKRILVCQHCKAFMEIDNQLWGYYSTYYNNRFDKTTTDSIIGSLSKISNDIEKNGIKLKIDDESSQQSLDFIYSNLCKKYNTPQNVEEIVSVFYKK